MKLYQIAFLFVLAMALFLMINTSEQVKADEIIVPLDYPTINSAIQNANVGDNISVWQGIYNQGVIVNKSVNLYGNGTDTIITGSSELIPLMNESFEGDWGELTNTSEDWNLVSWHNTSSKSVDGDQSMTIEGTVSGEYGCSRWIYPSDFTSLKLSFWYWTENLEDGDFEIKIGYSSSWQQWYNIDVSTQGEWVYFEDYIPFVDYYSDTFRFCFITTLIGSAEEVTVDLVQVYGVSNAHCIDIKTADVIFDNFYVSTADQNGIFLNETSSASITNCSIFSNNLDGLLVSMGGSHSISDSEIYSNSDSGVSLWGSSWNNISNCEIHTNNVQGIYGYLSEYTGIYNNDIVSNLGNGITGSFNHLIISGNNISSNTFTGINIPTSTFVNISTNQINANTHYGIEIGSHSTIWNNSITGNGGGIRMSLNTNVEITHNDIISNTAHGVDAYISTFINISYNFISGNGRGLYVEECSNTTVTHNEISSSLNEGIAYSIFWDDISYDNNISFNVLSSSGDTGLSLSNTHRTIICSNLINSTSNNDGIQLYYSNDNIISNTNLNGCEYGIKMISSSNNTIHNCTFEDNAIGIQITGDSYDNRVYRNEFISNDVQAIDSGINTTWNDESLTGNYWDDYLGRDNDGDGIGDTQIAHLGLDNYPITSNISPIIPLKQFMDFPLWITFITTMAVFGMVWRFKKKHIDKK